MRIIGGTHRGRKLTAPEGKDVRPTSDRTRQAIFNALQHRSAVVDAAVLDAFCGTGALGLEALSQGAEKAVFFDTARASLDLVKRNITDLGFDTQAQALQKDATRCGPRPDSVAVSDLVFLDPPYHKNLVPLATHALKDGGWLAKAGWLVVETEKGAAIQAVLDILDATVDSSKNYGETDVHFLHWGF